MPVWSTQPSPPLKSFSPRPRPGCALEVRRHLRRVAAHDGGAAAIELSVAIRPAKYVSNTACGERHARVELVQRLVLAVVVLAPGEQGAERHEQHDGDESRRSRAGGGTPWRRARRWPRARACPRVGGERRRHERHGAPSATFGGSSGGGRSAASQVLHDGDDLREADDVEDAPRLGARRREHAGPARRLDRPDRLDEGVDPARVDELDRGEVEDDVGGQLAVELGDAALELVRPRGCRSRRRGRRAARRRRAGRHRSTAPRGAAVCRSR